MLGSAGTECLDTDWLSLKTFLPKQLHRKEYLENCTSVVNSTLKKRVYQWAWRKSLAKQGTTPKEFLQELLKLCKES